MDRETKKGIHRLMDALNAFEAEWLARLNCRREGAPFGRPSPRKTAAAVLAVSLVAILSTVAPLVATVAATVAPLVVTVAPWSPPYPRWSPEG